MLAFSLLPPTTSSLNWLKNPNMNSKVSIPQPMSVKQHCHILGSIPGPVERESIEYTPWLIVGLGNPGNKYHGTRHNVGFEMVDCIARTEGIRLNTIQSKALFGIGSFDKVPILLVKPQAYMNFAGESIGPLAAYYQVPLRHILLIYDEMSLPNGVLRLSPKGGHGHHNGVKSVINHLDSCRDFPRLCIGIGNPPGQMDLRAFLLQKFSLEERKQPINRELGGGFLSMRNQETGYHRKFLAYLHEGLEPKVVHRDVKSSNILLDRQWNSKVSDFGLAKLLCSERSYVTTRVMGTFGYVAPEYASTGMLNERSDVYSFGVLIMEIITGRTPVDYSRPPGEVNLVEWLKNLVGERKSEYVVDPKIVEKPSSRTLKRALLIALRCVDPDALKRPRMGHVIHMLEMEELIFREDRKYWREAFNRTSEPQSKIVDEDLGRNNNQARGY